MLAYFLQAKLILSQFNSFISYLLFGLFHTIFMANASECMDNEKKIIEVDMAEKESKLHIATVVGNTFGDLVNAKNK